MTNGENTIEDKFSVSVDPKHIPCFCKMRIDKKVKNEPIVKLEVKSAVLVKE